MQPHIMQESTTVAVGATARAVVACPSVTATAAPSGLVVAAVVVVMVVVVPLAAGALNVMCSCSWWAFAVAAVAVLIGGKQLDALVPQFRPGQGLGDDADFRPGQGLGDDADGVLCGVARSDSPPGTAAAASQPLRLELGAKIGGTCCCGCSERERHLL